MGGGLMQLVAYGAQDIYLTGNPQITFFKKVYKRHTNFAIESMKQPFYGSNTLGSKFSCTISRNGDLLSQIYLELDVSLSQSVTNIQQLSITEDIDALVLTPNKLLSSITTNTTGATDNALTAEISILSGWVSSLVGQGGTGAKLQLTVDTSGEVTYIKVTDGGNGYSKGDIITIPITEIVGTTTPLVITLEVSDLVGSVTTMISNGSVVPNVNINTDHEVILNDGTNEIGLLDGSGDKYVTRTAGNREVQIQPGNDLRLSNEMGSRRIGLRAIKSIEILIGSTCIDRHYGDWMDIWTNLNSSEQKRDKHNRLVNASLKTGSSGNRKIYVPLQFWFCKNPGLALPLVSLKYHEVKLNVEFNPEVTYQHSTNTIAGVKLSSAPVALGTTKYTTNATVDITTINTVSMSVGSCSVYCDYIFLDKDERKLFSEVSHEYLIEQLQYSDKVSLKQGENQVDLILSHPVKEIIWVAQTLGNVDHNFSYWSDTALPNSAIINRSLLTINSRDRFSERDGSYFRCVQPYQHHTNGIEDSTQELGGCHVYSFGLKPEEYQPSGTCNFSRIEHAVLHLTSSNDSSLKVYAINYNVLRIISGMGGLAYAS